LVRRHYLNRICPTSRGSHSSQSWIPVRFFDRHYWKATAIHREHADGDYSALARRNVTTLVRVLQLWAVVLAANLVGAHLFAWVVGNTPMFGPEVQAAMLSVAQKAANVTFGTAILRGIFAGWLIAMVVWMLAAVDNGRIMVIVILTYLVGLAGLTHIIAGSVDVLFLVMVGAKSWLAVVWGYMLPTLIGNTIGGVSLTAALNHAHVVAGMQGKKKNRLLSV
jgi:formate/nitrite transporter FocA (FNT family)